ncbi:HipA family kinase [Bacillus stercoris]|uniref:HipA family kinase n=1 Tax=Bacillus stercoris TaxID=2054641 RepID=UPI0040455F13
MYKSAEIFGGTNAEKMALLVRELLTGELAQINKRIFKKLIQIIQNCEVLINHCKGNACSVIITYYGFPKRNPAIILLFMVEFSQVYKWKGEIAGDLLNHFELQTYNVVKYEKEMGNGITNPLLMQTDNDFYIVKVAENDEGPRVLINEYVCYKLAKLLGIPIPEAALINIEADVIDITPYLKEKSVKPGIHFGSKFIKKAAVPIHEPLLRLITNTEDVPSIILFDQIIYNNDRTQNKGNLMIDLKEKQLLAIDHSHPFKIGALWDAGQLNKIHEDGLCLVNEFHGHNYKVLLRYVNGNNPFNKILQKLERISEEDIDWCFEGLPQEWELSDSDKSALKNFIWYRICNIDTILKLLSDHCPGWKGGDLFGN